MLTPDRWLHWLGLLFVLSVYHFPTGIVRRLRALCASGHHHFWPDAVSLRDQAVFKAAFIRGHRQMTDVYLLGLAAKMRGCLATFDRTIPAALARGAARDTLQIISGT